MKVTTLADRLLVRHFQHTTEPPSFSTLHAVPTTGAETATLAFCPNTPARPSVGRPHVAHMLIFAGTPEAQRTEYTLGLAKLNLIPPTDGRGGHGNSRKYCSKKRDRVLKTIDVLLASLY